MSTESSSNILVTETFDIDERSIMRPNTPHYVYTRKPFMGYARHLICGATLDQTCFGIIHTLLGQSILTSTSNPNLLGYIPAFLRLWLDNLSLKTTDDPSTQPPVPFQLYSFH